MSACAPSARALPALTMTSDDRIGDGAGDGASNCLPGPGYSPDVRRRRRAGVHRMHRMQNTERRMHRMLHALHRRPLATSPGRLGVRDGGVGVHTDTNPHGVRRRASGAVCQGRTEELEQSRSRAERQCTPRTTRTTRTPRAPSAPNARSGGAGEFNVQRHRVLAVCSHAGSCLKQKEHKEHKEHRLQRSTRGAASPEP